MAEVLRRLGVWRSEFRSAEAEGWARKWIHSVAGRSSVPLESRLVETGLGRAHLLRTPGPPAERETLCFPGWGTNSAFWAVADQLSPLAELGPVSVIDVPGQPGLSAGYALPYGEHGFVRWVREVVDAVGARRVDLVGVSLGGFLAVKAAHGLGDRVDRVVLCAPAGFVWPFLGPREAVALLAHWLIPTPERTGTFVHECLLGRRQPLAPGVASELAEALSRFSEGFRNLSRPPIWLRDAELRRIDGRVLLLLGDSDPVFSPSGTLRRARRALGRFESRILTEHGHALELSGEVIAAAADFLRR